MNDFAVAPAGSGGADDEIQDYHHLDICAMRFRGTADEVPTMRELTRAPDDEPSVSTGTPLNGPQYLTSWQATLSN